MSTKGTNHMTIGERYIIESCINEGWNFKSIGKHLGRDSTTISREVKNHRTFVVRSEHQKNDCISALSCNKKHLCGAEDCDGRCANCEEYSCHDFCRQYESRHCEKLDSKPYVCNACRQRIKCKCQHVYYNAQSADTAYRKELAEARSGVHMPPEKRREVDALLAPLLGNGQSLGHIYATHAAEIGCSRRTIYNYIENRVLSTKSIDLPKKVSYRPRKPKPKPVRQYDYRAGRTFKDFYEYLEKWPKTRVIEMDTLKGTREKGKAILTLVFRDTGFMLGFLLPDCTQKSVKKVFDELMDAMHFHHFSELFELILTDNGGEFKDPVSLECADWGELRTRIYYCDPNCAWQKPHVERNNGIIRTVIPKGTSLDRLTQEDVTLLTNHINSYYRDILDAGTPFERAYPYIKELLEPLGLRRIPPDEVILKPALLKH